MKISRGTIPFLLLILPRTISTLPLIFLSPIISTLLLLRRGLKVSRKSVLLLISLLIINIATISINKSNFQNFALAIASYGFIFMLLLNQSRYELPGIARSWINNFLFLATVQGAIGVFQLFYNGFPFKLPYRDFTEDFFVGTLGTGGNNVIGNIMAVAIILCINLYDYDKSKFTRIGIAFFTVCLILTSSNMSVFTLVIAYILANSAFSKRLFFLPRGGTTPAIFLCQKKQGLIIRRVTLLKTAAGFVLVAGAIYSGGLSYAIDTYNKWAHELDINNNARVMALHNTFTSLPASEPYQPFIGIGLGNYSSWAQMILSEDYMRVHIIGKHVTSDKLLGLASQNTVAYENVLKYMSEDLFRAETESIVNQPFFSWQSMYAEIGVVGLLIFLILMRQKIKSLKIRDADSIEERTLKKTLIFYTFFIITNGFVDNYFEYPWIVVPYMIGLLSVSQRGRLRKHSEDDLI